MYACGFWECQRAVFFDVRVCYPSTDSYRNMEPQVYRIHENKKKRQYSRRVLDVEQETFTPLVFTTTGGVGNNAPGFIVDWQGSLPQRKKSNIPQPSPG